MPTLDLRGVLDWSPAPERSPVTIPARVTPFIDGTFVDEPTDGDFPTVNPATGETLTMVARTSGAQIDAAFAAARRAQTGVWGKMTGLERGKYLYRIARRLQERAREFAVVETMDNGKPIRETRDIDIPAAIQHFFYYAGWADKLGHALRGANPRPIGVCAQVIPWNFPLLMLAWKVAPALAAGNTVVLKPAETTPLTAWLFAGICQEVGLPEGVVNLVFGAGDVGAAVVAHPGADKVAFTGSTAVGRRILEGTAGTGKRLTLELGGKGAHLVFEDADLERAADGVITGIFTNQGHVCCAGSRLLVQESVRDDLLARIERRMSVLRVGDPLDKNTDVGAINSQAQHGRIARYLDIAAEEGAEVRAVHAGSMPDRGWFHAPTLLLGVQQTDTCAREEIFGPVLSVLTFRTPDEAVAKANDTEYGLAAGLWCDKPSRLFDVAHRLRAGVIWANGYNLFDAASPFGGVRHSGFGREGGLHGLWPYVEAS
jgi:aldehyde dehydrogenase (NAD+)